MAEVNATLQPKRLMLEGGTANEPTLIAAPSSIKDLGGSHATEIHQTKKSKPYHFGMTAHIGVDADSELVHTLAMTGAKAHDVTQDHNHLYRH